MKLFLPISSSSYSCALLRGVRFALCVAAVFLCATFGCSSRQAKSSASPVEATLREVFACINSGNAHKLYPLILQEERDKEKLTEEQLAILLKALGRCLIKGSKTGPMILQGSANNIEGFVVYRRQNNRKTTIGVYCRKCPDGTIGARGLTWNLVMAVANSISNPSEKTLARELDFRKSTVRGLKSLPDDLRLNGPQLLLGPESALSVDEFISQQENRIHILEAKVDEAQKSAGGN